MWADTSQWKTRKRAQLTSHINAINHHTFKCLRPAGYKLSRRCMDLIRSVTFVPGGAKVIVGRFFCQFFFRVYLILIKTYSSTWGVCGVREKTVGTSQDRSWGSGSYFFFVSGGQIRKCCVRVIRAARKLMIQYTHEHTHTCMHMCTHRHTDTHTHTLPACGAD